MERDPFRVYEDDWPWWLEPVLVLLAVGVVALYFALCLWGPLP